MTYWGYHLIFTIPVIAILVWLNRKRIRRVHVLWYLVVCAIVMLFTTPWDNYAVYLGIWGFGDGVSLGYPFADLAISEDNPGGMTWLGLIPFEEYSFFIIETTMACLLALYFLPHPESGTAAKSKQDQSDAISTSKE